MRVAGAIKHIQHVASLGLGSRIVVPEMLGYLGDVIPGSFNSFFWLDNNGMVSDAYAPHVILSAFQFFGAAYPTLPRDEPTFDKIIAIGREVGGARLLHARHDYSRSLLCNDIWRPYGIGCGLDVVLRRDGQPRALLFVNRDTNANRFTAAEYRVLHALAPHFAHALLPADSTAAIDSTEERVGMMVVAADGTVLSTCDQMLQLVIRLCTPDELGAAAASFDLRHLPRPLRVLLDRHRSIARGEPSAPPAIERHTPWGMFRATAFPQHEPGRFGPPASYVVRLAQHLPREVRLARRVALLGLSPRERQVAFHLASGKAADACAAAMGVSISTWRSYVKHVYERLGIGSRGAFHLLMQKTPGGRPH